MMVDAAVQPRDPNDYDRIALTILLLLGVSIGSVSIGMDSHCMRLKAQRALIPQCAFELSCEADRRILFFVCWIGRSYTDTPFIGMPR